MDLKQVEIVVSLLVLVAPVLGAAYKLLIELLPANQRAALEQDVAVVVKAVEQVYGDVPGVSGEAKKAFALSQLQALGVKDSPLVDSLLEAAVHTLNQAAPTVVTAPAPVVGAGVGVEAPAPDAAAAAASFPSGA